MGYLYVCVCVCCVRIQLHKLEFKQMIVLSLFLDNDTKINKGNHYMFIYIFPL